VHLLVIYIHRTKNGRHEDQNKKPNPGLSIHEAAGNSIDRDVQQHGGAAPAFIHRQALSTYRMTAKYDTKSHR
jgi:hypothetical protein